MARSIARLLDAWRPLPPLFDPRHPRFRRTFACFWGLLFSWCLIIHALAGHWLTTWQSPDMHAEPVRIAKSLIEHGTFANPFFPLPTGPTAHIGPLYPALYAALWAMFGSGRALWLSIRIVTVAAWALQWAMLPGLALKLGIPVRAGLIAAAIGAMLPMPGSCFKTEAIFTGLILVLLCYAVARARELPALATYMAISVLAGIGLLISPTILVVLLPWLFVLLDPDARMRSWGVRVIPVAAAIVLIVSPWLVRNYRIFHAVFLVRDNFGTELAISNNDCASPWADEGRNSGCASETHPNGNRVLAEQVRDLNEYRFNQKQERLAVAWIRSHPARFIQLTAARILYFWVPPISLASGGFARVNAFVSSLLSVLAAIGLVLMARRASYGFWMLLPCFVLFPLVHYVVQVELRYRYPILWAILIAAAYAICTASSHWRAATSSPDASALYGQPRLSIPRA